MIQDSLDYIEENLKSELSAQELAGRANFSLFHYYRLFEMAVGMPVMQYIARRKLLHAMYEISCGRKIIDAALDYGFDTYAGFYKAFKREFGYSPGEFLKNNKLNRPYKINLFREGHKMVTHKKLNEILGNWNLENQIVRDIFYESGEKSESAFYAGEDHLIKVFFNLGALKNEITILRELEKLGIDSAIPVKTADGRDFIQDGPYYFFLTKRLKGERMKAGALYEGDYPGKARFLGEIIGQLSLALEKIDAVADDGSLYDSVKNWALPKTKEVMEIPEDLCKGVIQYFGTLYSSLPRQIIHRNLTPSNLIVEGDKWGIIDFELSERDVRIFDPCYAATAIFSESFEESNPERLAQWITIYQNIISGYDAVRKLSENEKKAIPYVVLCNQLICCAWFAGQEKYKKVFSVNQKMTKWICANFDKLAVE